MAGHRRSNSNNQHHGEERQRTRRHSNRVQHVHAKLAVTEGPQRVRVVADSIAAALRRLPDRDCDAYIDRLERQLLDELDGIHARLQQEGGPQ